MPALSLSLNHAGKVVPVTEEAEKHDDKSQTKPLNQQRPVKDLGSVTDTVGEIIDLGRIR